MPAATLLLGGNSSAVLASKFVCCCRRARKDGLASVSSEAGSAWIVSQPGLLCRSSQGAVGVRTCSHALCNEAAWKSSRQVKLPLVGGDDVASTPPVGAAARYGTVLPWGKITGQSSFQVTGSRKVSRPVL